VFRITAVRGDDCGFRLGVGAPIDYDSVERRNWNDPLPIRAGIYARVSTEDQHCEIQLDKLRAYVQRSGWHATEYVEKLSGKEGSRRPQLDRLLTDARVRKLDVVVVCKLDRFGRSTVDTLSNVRTLGAAGVRFLCPEMGIDTDNKNPVGQFLLTIFAAIAELEHSFILERTTAGFRAYRDAHAAGHRQHAALQIGQKPPCRPTAKGVPSGPGARAAPWGHELAEDRSRARRSTRDYSPRPPRCGENMSRYRRVQEPAVLRIPVRGVAS
jgi:putative DNA-invertase from lambdoid prophage Rac